MQEYGYRSLRPPRNFPHEVDGVEIRSSLMCIVAYFLPFVNWQLARTGFRFHSFDRRSSPPFLFLLFVNFFGDVSTCSDSPTCGLIMSPVMLLYVIICKSNSM